MAKSIITVKVTELDIVKELIYMIEEYFLELPEEMQDEFFQWKAKLEDKK